MKLLEDLKRIRENWKGYNTPFTMALDNEIAKLERENQVANANVNRVCSCKKDRYIYQGNEVVRFGEDNKNQFGKPFTCIKWNDETETYCFKDSDEEAFDHELGMLVCVAKKFAPSINIKKLYHQRKQVKKNVFEDVYSDIETIKESLRQIIKATAGKRALRDIRPFAKKSKETYEFMVGYKKKLAKLQEKKKKRFEKLDKLKKEGKYVSNNDFLKALEENKRLKAKKEAQSRIEEYNKIVKENEEMKKEFEK